jgi:hypothetical protein
VVANSEGKVFYTPLNVLFGIFAHFIPTFGFSPPPSSDIWKRSLSIGKTAVSLLTRDYSSSVNNLSSRTGEPEVHEEKRDIECRLDDEDLLIVRAFFEHHLDQSDGSDCVHMPLKQFTLAFQCAIYPPFFAGVFHYFASDGLSGASSPSIISDPPLKMDRNTFEGFISAICRSSSYTAMQHAWEAVSLTLESKEERVRTFFLVMLELGGCDQEGIRACCHELMKRFNHYLHSNNQEHGSYMDVVDFSLVMEWIEKCAPCMCDIFPSFVSRKVFGLHVDSSGAFFTPPRLIHEEFDMNGTTKGLTSSIITQSDIFPLSLYERYAQGDWRMIYCMVRDGFSFAALVRGVLGYGVRIVE